jgi:hypothetical protein
MKNLEKFNNANSLLKLMTKLSESMTHLEIEHFLDSLPNVKVQVQHCTLMNQKPLSKPFPKKKKL